MRRESGAIDSPVQVPSTDKDRSKANKSRVIYSTSDAAQFHCPACHQLSSQTSDDSDSEVSGHHRDCPQLRAEKRIAKLKRPEGHVAIVVGGRRFTIARTMLQQHPDTMLGRMFGSSFDTSLTQSSETGDFPITKEISPATFKAILDFYKHGTIRCPPNVTASELREACSYFLIPFTHQSVKCEDLGKFLHELSSNGAQSQFELQLRVLMGLPLTPVAQHSPCVMLNLLGDLWWDASPVRPQDSAFANDPLQPQEPDWSRLLALPGTHLHLYGKKEARRCRKMGHLNITGSSPEAVKDTVDQCLYLLGLGGSGLGVSPRLVQQGDIWALQALPEP